MAVDEPKANKWNWLLWWRVDPKKLDEQVIRYKELHYIESARGHAAGAILFIIVMMIVLVYLASISAIPSYVSADSGLLDIVLWVVLVIFVYRGHQWAIVAAMILWTFEKLFGSLMIVTASHVPSGIIVNVIWWAAFMHIFYFSFRVERERKRRSRVFET